MVYFISEKNIKDYSNIDLNTDTHYILPAIRESQEIDLQTLIGKRLYTILQDTITDGKIDDEDNLVYKEMLSIIKYYLVYTVMSNIILTVNFKINNGGIQQASDEHLQPIDMKNAKELKQYYTNKADFYANRLREYMIRNYDELGIKEDCLNDLRAQVDNIAPCQIYLGGAQNSKNSRRRYFNSHGYDKPWL